MKTSIVITGQIGSVSTLRNQIETIDSETKNLQFNNVQVIFNTKKEAVKALSNAFQSLREDESVSYLRGASISYDAARAYIVD